MRTDAYQPILRTGLHQIEDYDRWLKFRSYIYLHFKHVIVTEYDEFNEQWHLTFNHNILTCVFRSD